MADPTADAVLSPGPDAPAEPYFAIMHVDAQGVTDGNLWTFGKRIMLFPDGDLAQRVAGSLNKPDGDTQYGRRGVTEAHLEAIKGLVEGTEVEVFVVIGIDPKGTIEAVPLAEHQEMLPPPLPPA